MARKTYTGVKVGIASTAAGLTVVGAAWLTANQPAAAEPGEPVAQEVTAPLAASSSAQPATSNTTTAQAGSPSSSPKPAVTPRARVSRGS